MLGSTYIYSKESYQFCSGNRYISGDGLELCWVTIEGSISEGLKWRILLCSNNLRKCNLGLLRRIYSCPKCSKISFLLHCVLVSLDLLLSLIAIPTSVNFDSLLTHSWWPWQGHVCLLWIDRIWWECKVLGFQMSWKACWYDSMNVYLRKNTTRSLSTCWGLR